jgi:hypothetical protein
MTANQRLSLSVILLLTGVVATGCDVINPPEKRACARVSSLCGLEPEAAGQCSQKLSELSRDLGKERLDKLATCVAEAQSCPEAGGCMAGVGLSALTDSAGKFLKGLGKTLSN